MENQLEALNDNIKKQNELIEELIMAILSLKGDDYTLESITWAIQNIRR